VAFLGVESATIPADDVEKPDKTIPRATVPGTIVTALVYILSTVTVMGIIPLAQPGNSSAPFADAAVSIWSKWAYNAVVIGAVISCLGNLNGFTLIQDQVPQAVTRDCLFPKLFGRMSKVTVPTAGIAITSALIKGQRYFFAHILVQPVLEIGTHSPEVSCAWKSKHTAGKGVTARFSQSARKM